MGRGHWGIGYGVRGTGVRSTGVGVRGLRGTGCEAWGMDCVCVLRQAKWSKAQCMLYNVMHTPVKSFLVTRTWAA